MMRKILVAVEDRRFQTWRQVKSWTMRHYRRQQRGNKSLPSAPSSSAPATRKTRNPPSFIRTPFEKNLVPIVNVTEMKMKAKNFLNSVKEAIGTRKLRRAFQHRLTCGELPEDISQLIFSPLYLKLCRRQIWKVTAARNANHSESDSSDDDEWSDWEEYSEVSPDHDSGGGDGPTTATGTHLHILPSIEGGDRDSREDDPLERPVTGQRTDKPSTPIKTRELEIRDSRGRINHQARRREKYDGCKAGNGGKHSSRCRLLTSPYPQNSPDEPVCRPVPDLAQAQIQVVESPHPRKDTAGLSFPPIPWVRPFADLMLPTGTVTPGPEVESIFRIGGLLCDTNERGADERIDVDNVSKVTSNPQDSTNPTPKEKKKSPRETVGEEQYKDPSMPSTRYISRKTYQLKGGPMGTPSSTRRTPAILAAENLRQGRKLAKPLAAKKIPSRAPLPKKTSPVKTHQVHGEIQPPMFYNVLAGGSAVISRANPELQVNNTLQPKLSEHIRDTEGRDTEGGRSDREDKENRAGGSNGAVFKSVPRQRSLSHQSDLSDDDISLPPVEELYERAIHARGSAMSRADISRTTTQAKSQRQPETAAQLGNNKKRPRWGPSSEDCNISALSTGTRPWKRMRSRSRKPAWKIV
ncbi:hypothetical protein F4823DRAFT_204674 [Ustulina deusta]|nr:hypothetical protein F4823DRAFT_204674 [Ustulina deusta]